MSSADAVAAVLWIGVTFYAVFGGADFGAGFWALLAGGGERGKRPRELIDWAIGPVWEANHVWLIFVLVVLWTGFPDAFEAVTSTLFIPLSLAALGIVLRGSGFAFQNTARTVKGRNVARHLFGILLAAHAVLHGDRRRRGRLGKGAGGQRRGRRRHQLAQSALVARGGAVRRDLRLYRRRVPRERRSPRRCRRPRALLHDPGAGGRRRGGSVGRRGDHRPARGRALRLRGSHTRGSAARPPVGGSAGRACSSCFAAASPAALARSPSARSSP